MNYCLQAETVQNSFTLMQENKRGWIFSLEEELWIMDLFDEKRWF